MWSRNGLPPPALSPCLLDRRSAPRRPVANASIYPRICHAICFLLHSSSFVGYAHIAPDPAVKGVRPAVLTSTLNRYAVSLQARRATAPHAVFPALVFPSGHPFPRRPFQKGIPPGAKPIQGETARASFCLEIARPAGGRSHHATP